MRRRGQKKVEEVTEEKKEQVEVKVEEVTPPDIIEKKEFEDAFYTKIKEFKGQIIDQPLDFEELETDAEDWDNVPEISTKSIMYLQKHHKATVKYLNDCAKLETTASLRSYAETRMDVS